MEEERTIDPYRSAEIPSISDRLEFLFDNPLQIQELTFKENCKPLNEILDLTCSPNLQVNQDIAHSERYQIVNFQRLIFSYHANRLYLRVVDAKSRPVVLVLPPENVAAFVNSSRDAYSTLLADWDRAPPVVIELFNSSFTFSHRSRYGILVYDFVFRSWELIGFIAPLGCDKSESGQSPNPIIRLIEYFQPNLKVNYTAVLFYCSYKYNLDFLLNFTFLKRRKLIVSGLQLAEKGHHRKTNPIVQLRKFLSDLMQRLSFSNICLQNQENRKKEVKIVSSTVE
jgi:hypothetical protein